MRFPDSCRSVTLSPGKLADFAVLSADPFSVEPEALFDIQVDATILGGELVFAC